LNIKTGYLGVSIEPKQKQPKQTEKSVKLKFCVSIEEHFVFLRTLYRDLAKTTAQKRNEKRIKQNNHCIFSQLNHHTISDFLVFLKGTVSRDFRPSGFFHQSNPHRSLINRL
jgi:hypothetical protein